ncbi:MAG: hypothetical protein V4638_06680 [Bacteroidota bacterium]
MMRHFSFLFGILFGFSALAQCDEINPLNQEIVDLASAKMGKKVLRGECWDLAKYVLDETGATWDGLLNYGNCLEKGACLMPGDIIQFKNVVIKYQKGNVKYTETMYHHTAIILEVTAKNEVVLIHQNTGTTGRKVGTSSLHFSNITKGTYWIYRPVSK